MSLAVGQKGLEMEKSTILIVDDEPVGRETLEALLFRHGYRLAFAGDGPETLTKAAELVPDLILLDVMMPGMDGFEVCQRLRADPVLAEVPIIMVTALDDRDSRLRGIEAGADDFITKPYDRVELRARVAGITRLNRYRRLLAERTRFEWVVEHASDGYVMVDEQDRVLYANPQARLYLGLPPSGPMPAAIEGASAGTKFGDLAGEQYRCEPQEAWATWPLSPTGDSSLRRYLVRPESPTAGAFWLLVDAFDLASGKDGGHVVRLRDVTTEMVQQRDMRGFHDMIRHKMRTPLTGMMTGLELLTRYADKLSTEQVAELSTAAYKSVKRLHGAIEDILAYLGAPGLAVSSERFELEQLEAMATEIGSQLGIESMAVSLSEDIRGSRTMLSQRAVELALWEILENATKFHAQSSPHVELLASRANPGEICLQIRDDGTAISPEHLERIWTPYYQGEKYFTGEAPGMGLGLPTVSALVWETGGSCRAYNREDGPGVIIELILPEAPV
jgi:CheY-like chemotaxis protein